MEHNTIECKRCNQTYPDHMFIKDTTRKSGKHPYCKFCVKKIKQDAYAKRKEHYQIKQSEWHSKNADRWKDNAEDVKFNKFINRWARKIYFIKKLNNGVCACSMCGCTNYIAIDFHHTDPTTKDSNWSHLQDRPLNVIWTELQKCIPVCKICHTNIHVNLDNINKNMDLIIKKELEIQDEMEKLLRQVPQ